MSYKEITARGSREFINDRDVLYAFEGEERDDPERMIEAPGKKRIIV